MASHSTPPRRSSRPPSKASKSITSVSTLPTLSLSPLNTASFGAADVNRKVCEHNLLKALSRTAASRARSLPTLLLAKGASTSQAVLPALAALSEAEATSATSTSPIVRATVLYTISLYLSNRSTPPSPAAITAIIPILVKAACTASPRHDHNAVQQWTATATGKDGMERDNRRIYGWSDSVPWDGASSSNDGNSVMSNGSLYNDSSNPFAESIKRLDGSASAVLRLLKEETKRAANRSDGVTSDDEEQLTVVKTGSITTVSHSSSATNKPPPTKEEASLLDEISQLQGSSGVVKTVHDEQDSSDDESELSLFEDSAPLSTQSIRRAGIIGLACIVSAIASDQSQNSRQARRTLAISGGIDALLLLAYHPFNDGGRTLEQESSAATGTVAEPSAQPFSPLNSERSSLSSSTFSSSVYSETTGPSQTTEINPSKSAATTAAKPSSKATVNAYLAYQSAQRNQQTADALDRLGTQLKAKDSMYRYISNESKISVELNKVVNSALTLVGADELKRLTVYRTAELRKYLEDHHPMDWVFKCDPIYFDFCAAQEASSAFEHCRRAGCGLFWYIEEPLSLLYEAKIRSSLMFSKQMSAAKTSVASAKKEKNKVGMDLKKRLKAAKKEADAEFAIGELNRQRKRETLERKNEESDKARKMRLMRDLAKSTEILVASLRSDGVDVEKYFREIEIEERKEAWEKQYENMEAVEVEVEVETVVVEEEEVEIVESELERRERLREETKQKRESADDEVEMREAKELKRIAAIKNYARQNEKEAEKQKKLGLRDGNRWCLDRKQELKIEDHKEKKSEKEEELKRKEKFKKYLQKVENKAGKKRREEEAEEREREQEMEKRRMVWFDEEESKRALADAEEERLNQKERKKEEERLRLIKEVKRKKQEKLGEKRRKFLAYKSVALSRLGNSTWMKKDGKVVFYDKVGWKEEVGKIKEDLVAQGLMEKDEEKEGEEKEGAEKEEGEEEKEEVKDDLGEYTIIKQKEEKVGGGTKSEWVDEVAEDGRKYQTNQITGEMRFV